MPTEQDDDNHNDEEPIATTTITGATSSGNAVPTKTFLPVNPTDHPDRPTKPTDTPATTASATPSPSSKSSWLPSFFPTFGVSSRTQIWIYGAGALILVFCGALGVYFFLARRKRLRNNPREEWEFDVIQDDEAEGLTSGGAVGAAKTGKGGKRRAGELYDAFAAGSDDDSDEEYQDTPFGVAPGGDEQEKRLYDSDDEEQHVIGDDDSDDEKR